MRVALFLVLFAGACSDDDTPVPSDGSMDARTDAMKADGAVDAADDGDIGGDGASDAGDDGDAADDGSTDAGIDADASEDDADQPDAPADAATDVPTDVTMDALADTATDTGMADTGGGTPCTTSDDCARGELCEGPEGCGIEWTCQPAHGCTRDIVEYCSCRDETVRGSGSCPPEPFRHLGACENTPCSSDDDCRLFSDYCGGCFCRALRADADDLDCPEGELVACFADPCLTNEVACVRGTCIVTDL